MPSGKKMVAQENIGIEICNDVYDCRFQFGNQPQKKQSWIVS